MDQQGRSMDKIFFRKTLPLSERHCHFYMWRQWLTKLSLKIVKANLVKLAEGAKRHSDLVLIFSLREEENCAYQQKVKQLNSMMFDVYPRENAQVNGIVFYRWDKWVYTTTVDGTHLTEGGYRRAALID